MVVTQSDDVERLESERVMQSSQVQLKETKACQTRLAKKARATHYM